VILFCFSLKQLITAVDEIIQKYGEPPQQIKTKQAPHKETAAEKKEDT
jgi:hypothetical protein